ncbi:hypothetical protein BN2537_6217 [Streptomyces venezuelae]|nr:hypothetical protein BN2537_6217 [Streptomyces venezuelae]
MGVGGGVGRYAGGHVGGCFGGCGGGLCVVHTGLILRRRRTCRHTPLPVSS